MADLPTPLQRLLERLRPEVEQATAALEASGDTAQWQRTLSRLLARYHAAALMVGQDSPELSASARRQLEQTVAAQLDYLGNFATEVQSEAAFKPGWKARANLYAEGVGQSYWRGATRMLPLPAVPRDGTTQCLGRCGCSWEIDQLDGEGNYNATWRYGDTQEHCATCIERAHQWNPLKIRDGRLVI